jgi:hypothetical protein
MADEMQEIEARLAAYVDGTLPADQRAEIEAYLKANASHGRLIAELKSIKTAVATLPKEKAPAEVLDGLQAHLERHQLLEGVEESVSSSRIQRWPQFGALAAVLMLAAGLGILVYAVLPKQKGPPPEFAILPDALSTQPTGSNEVPVGGASLDESPTADKRSEVAREDRTTLGLSARASAERQAQYQQNPPIYTNGMSVEPQVSNTWPPQAEPALKMAVPPAAAAPVAQSALSGPTRVLTVTTDDPILTANLIASYFSQVNLNFQRVGSIESVLPGPAGEVRFGLSDAASANQPMATTAPQAISELESARLPARPATRPSEVVVLRELSARQVADAETAVRAQRFTRQRTEADWVGRLSRSKDTLTTQPSTEPSDGPITQMAVASTQATMAGFGGGGAAYQAGTTLPADADAAPSNLVIVVVLGAVETPSSTQPATQSASTEPPATQPATQP